jgi:hypothetical protein
MAQTAAHLVNYVIPHVPVRQWVLSLPIPLRLLLAAQPQLVTPVLQAVHRVITRFLLCARQPAAEVRVRRRGRPVADADRPRPACRPTRASPSIWLTWQVPMARRRW